jgi:hypothetical protein
MVCPTFANEMEAKEWQREMMTGSPLVLLQRSIRL